MNQDRESICIRIRLEAQLRGLLQETPHHLQCPGDSSVIDALRLLAKQPEIQSRLFADSGEFSSSILVFRNGTPVTHSALSATILCDEDEIILFPPISGG